MIEKTCTQCHVTKPITEFGVDKQCKDGYRGNCKQCKKESVARGLEGNKPTAEPKRRARTQTKNTGKYEALIARYLSGEMYDD